MRRIFATFRKHFELFCWFSALICLYYLSPGGEHFSLCPLNNLGFNFCPGCGIGNAIHFGLHLNFKASFEYHPAGLPAIAILSNRIYYLSMNIIKNYERETYTSNPGH